ncbi:MAG TPA: exosortase family protein XrtF [Cyclobacteriaceae bacterium]|nr:exosortase family protein XrtF [Cyclobacteriaceae bacterium]
MKEQKAILFFLLKFIGLYLVLNTIYGLWISEHDPLPDPLTRIVAHQAAAMVSLTEDNITIGVGVRSGNVPIQQNGKTIVSVFEGCNGLNVMIVFVSFIAAFTGTWKKTLLFGLAGIALIYISNLFRVSLLFYISKYYPNNLYFFHKYLFTALLYVLVFFLWYFWVKKIWPKKP